MTPLQMTIAAYGLWVPLVFIAYLIQFFNLKKSLSINSVFAAFCISLVWPALLWEKSRFDVYHWED